MLGFNEAKAKLSPKVNAIVTGTPSNTKNLNFIKLEYKPQNEVRAVDFSELREKMLIGG